MTEGLNQFNLIDEPWIRVRMHSGDISLLSIRNVFAQATSIEGLRNDNAAQDFAILRLLLAILQRALAEDIDEDDEPARVWKELWDAEELPLGKTDRYLSTWHQRFYLLDDERPFMQVAGLTALNGEVSGIGKIIADIPDGSQFFVMRNAMDNLSLQEDEAARWVVHTQAFDIAGIKSGVVGDSSPNVKGGKSYPIGVGWSGKLGGLYVEGDDLRETILLNLVLHGDSFGQVFDLDDKPVWERAQAGLSAAQRVPSGRMDVYTWQSRRLCLNYSDDGVNGVVLTNGDRLEPHNRELCEPMTRWRRSENQERELGFSPVFMPLTHSPGKALWRGLQSVLPIRQDEYESLHASGIINWIEYLMSPNGKRALSEDRPLRVRAVGYRYGTMNSSFTQLIDDQLDIRADLLRPENHFLVELVNRCVANTEIAVRAVGRLAQNLYLAEGGDTSTPEGVRQRSVNIAYFEIDPKFRLWLSRLDARHDAIEKEDEWNKTARSTLQVIAHALLNQASNKALVGRTIKQNNKEIWMTAARAETFFNHNLYDALPDCIDAKQGKVG